MAIVTCKECKAEVSSQAAACPKCGAPPPKETSRLTLLALGCVLFVAFKCTVDGLAEPSADADRKSVDAKLTPEERAARDRAQESMAKARQEEERRFQLAVGFARTLKAGMKNPASFELTDAIRTADGTLCLQYRGTNSFNAVIPNYAVLTQDGRASNGSAGTVASLWNKHCAGKSGDDVTRIRHAL